MSTMLLAGLYTKRLPSWLTWSKYISHLTYIYNVFVRMEFEYAIKLFKCVLLFLIIIEKYPTSFFSKICLNIINDQILTS